VTLRTAPLAIYAAATGLMEPLAPMLLRRRARAGKEDAARLNERLGRPTAPRPDGPLVWLHGVSVGESLSLLPLIAALQAARPDLAILVTSGTVTSADVLAKRLPPGVIHQYAPVDAPGAAARVLDHWKPGAILLVESELWPNLIVAAKARGVKLALLSARMTEDSAAGWRQAAGTARALLRAFDLILPQDDATEGRLVRLGARVGPHLNLKLATATPPVDEAALAALRHGVAGRKVVLAASTHPGEEALIAEAFRTATAGREDVLLIVAPRHPERGAQVAALLLTLGFMTARRAAGDAIEPRTTAYIADTLGELGVFYTLADVVIMAGGFVGGVGGHNPIEAAQLARPMITGPHVFNAEAIYAEMRADGAVIAAADGPALARHIAGLLANPMIARRIGEAAQAYAARQGAALAEAMSLIAPLLPA